MMRLLKGSLAVTAVVAAALTTGGTASAMETSRLAGERSDSKAARAEGGAEGRYAFVGVSVLPMDTERVLQDQTVLVEDGVIVWVGASGDAQIPADATRIDGGGRFLMPGLAEMHAHVPPVAQGRPPQQLLEDYMFLYVANGVTTIRGMLGAPYQIDLRDELEREELIGPRFYPGAPSMNGNSAPNPAAGEALMRASAAAGYDLMKIHPGFSRATWDRMVEVANEVGLTFGGHVPAAVGVEHALRSGMSTIDHVDGYLEAASSTANPPFGGQGVGPAQIVAGLDNARLEELAELTAEMQAFVVPTQYLWENLFGGPDVEARLSQPEMRYVSRQQINAWRNQAGQYPGVEPAVAGPYYAARNRMLRLLADRDLVMMGTDSPQLYNVPGFALHREIDVMAEAGMSNFQILRSGTTTVGRYLNQDLGKSIQLGQVAEGFVADLVLLEGNPMADLGQLRNRAGVMVRGRWVTASEIDAGLADIAARNTGN